MKKTNLIKILISVMILVLTAGVMAGCSQNEKSAAGEKAGTLIMKVNPEIAVNYDEKGNVVSLEALNDDAEEILKNLKDYEGKSSNDVIKELIKLLSDAGYFKAGDDGQGNPITFTVTEGSAYPNEKFLDEIITNVKSQLADKNITGKIIIEGESNYGVSEYNVSDYGNSNYDNTVQTTGNSGNSSNYDNNTNYDSNSSYDNNSNYGSTSTTGNSGYDSNTNYDSNSSYDSSSNYDSDTDDDQNSGYDD